MDCSTVDIDSGGKRQADSETSPNDLLMEDLQDACFYGSQKQHADVELRYASDNFYNGEACSTSEIWKTEKVEVHSGKRPRWKGKQFESVQQVNLSVDSTKENDCKKLLSAINIEAFDQIQVRVSIVCCLNVIIFF